MQARALVTGLGLHWILTTREDEVEEMMAMTMQLKI